MTVPIMGNGRGSGGGGGAGGGFSSHADGVYESSSSTVNRQQIFQFRPQTTGVPESDISVRVTCKTPVILVYRSTRCGQKSKVFFVVFSAVAWTYLVILYAHKSCQCIISSHRFKVVIIVAMTPGDFNALKNVETSVQQNYVVSAKVVKWHNIAVTV